MNTCDYDHQTKREVRRLPIAGCGENQSAINVCQVHYATEIAFRRERARQTGLDKWEFPEWNDLAVEAPELIP